MIKDILLSFRDNFKEKTTNPFLGTYLIIWLIRNWVLVYSIFNFDGNSRLKDKVSFIQTYFANNPFIEGIAINVFWTFVILVITYALLNLSRAVVNLSEKQVKPWVYKLTDSQSIVLRSVYENIRNERDELQVRLDRERESKSKLELRIKNLEEEIIERERAVAEREGEESFVPVSSNDVGLLFSKLESRGLIEDFKEVCIKIRKGEYISNDHPNLDEYLGLGLIDFRGNEWNESKKYHLSDEGNQILRTIMNKD